VVISFGLLTGIKKLIDCQKLILKKSYNYLRSIKNY